MSGITDEKEHITDNDEFPDEWSLSREHPSEYSHLVDGDPWNYVEDGIRHIIVKDMDIEQRYTFDGVRVHPIYEEIF